MTSDAKIGLLLGLVFIFVIAFIINGLPNLRPQTGKAEVTTNMVNLADDGFGVADKAQRAQEVFDWSPLGEQQETNENVLPPTIVADSPSAGEPSQTANDQDVRSIRLLPDLGNLLENLTAGLQKEQVTTVNMDGAKPASEPPVETPQPTGSGTRTADSREPAKPGAGPARGAPKVYVVADGETLAAVAKKVYGPEEGNRIVNVQRIFEANKDILKSIDEVRSGQKLVIPPPAPPLAKPADVLPKTLFEKVDSLRKPTPANTPPKAPEGRWYVVQDGDNLWKIAASQLGHGARYEEIAKLNADILKNSDCLDVGMRLRLPAK
jgi:nucleoid-associated protein YgaU